MQCIGLFFFTLSGKVIDGLLIVRKIEVKLLIIFYRLVHSVICEQKRKDLSGTGRHVRIV